jgi:hypothetical protein
MYISLYLYILHDFGTTEPILDFNYLGQPMFLVTREGRSKILLPKKKLKSACSADHKLLDQNYTENT